MRHRGGDFFAADRALQARMLLAVVLDVALVLSLVGVVLWLTFAVHDGWSIAVFVVAVPALGAFAAPAIDWHGWTVDVKPAHQQRLEGAVQRLCVVGDMRALQCIAYGEFLPLSFTVARPRAVPRLYVTVGMLRLLNDSELDGVVAHELSHIAHHDAALMTVLAGPGVWMINGVRKLWADRGGEWFRPACAVVTFGVLFVPLAVILTAVSRIVSRQRELTADHNAALLTGSPAGLASALTRISQALERTSVPDLRAVTARDEFHIIPANPAPRGIRRVWATHPKTHARITRLQQMEADLQHASISPDPQ